jgi:hypothetical protein
MGTIIGFICQTHNKYISGDRCPECEEHPVGKSPTIIPDIQPFVTSNITGEPIEVGSRREKKRLLKDHGLVEQSPNSSARNRGERGQGPDTNLKWRG